MANQELKDLQEKTIIHKMLGNKAKYPVNTNKFIDKLLVPINRFLLGIGMPKVKNRITTTEDQLWDFLSVAYLLGLYYTDFANRLNWATETEELWRNSRKRFAKARTKIESCRQNLDKIEDSLVEERKDLLKDWAPFRQCRQALDGILVAIKQQEAIHAAFVHPKLRTDLEKTLAADSPLRYLNFHPIYSPSEDPKKMIRDIVLQLNLAIAEFAQGKKIRADRIHRFVVEYFAVLGLEISKGRITKILKERHKPKLMTHNEVIKTKSPGRLYFRGKPRSPFR